MYPQNLHINRYSDDVTSEGGKNANAFDMEVLDGLEAGFVLKLTHAQLEPKCFWTGDEGAARKWLEAFNRNAIVVEFNGQEICVDSAKT